MLRKLFLMPDDHRPQDEIAARQEMQAALIELDRPQTQDVAGYSFEWLHAHSDSFRVAYNELSTERPDIIRMWKQEPAEMLRIMKERMKEVEGRI